MQNTMTQKRKVINYLTKGRTLSAAQARSMFGVKNLRATISNIRSLVGQYGNWEIINEGGRYEMFDIHPGKRTYRFGPNGRRTKTV